MNAERIAKAVWNAYANMDWDELGPGQQREMIAAAQAELRAIVEEELAKVASDREHYRLVHAGACLSPQFWGREQALRSMLD